MSLGVGGGNAEDGTDHRKWNVGSNVFRSFADVVDNGFQPVRSACRDRLELFGGQLAIRKIVVRGKRYPVSPVLMPWAHPRNRAGTMSCASIGCRDRRHSVATSNASVAGVRTGRAK